MKNTHDFRIVWRGDVPENVRQSDRCGRDGESLGSGKNEVLSDDTVGRAIDQDMLNGFFGSVAEWTVRRGLFAEVSWPIVVEADVTSA